MGRGAIFGIGGLHNFGSEAIIRRTVEFIRRVYGYDAVITSYSCNIEEDKHITNEFGMKL